MVPRWRKTRTGETSLSNSDALDRLKDPKWTSVHMGAISVPMQTMSSMLMLMQLKLLMIYLFLSMQEDAVICRKISESF